MATDNEARTRQIFQRIFNEGRLDELEEMAAPGLVAHYGTHQVVGLDAYRTAWQESHDAFPDERFTVETTVTSGDTVVARWSWDATNRGGYLGSAPDGQRVTTTGISIYRFQDGRVVEAWVEMNELDLARQLGVFAPA
jgi:predicted ester cyclase